MKSSSFYTLSSDTNQSPQASNLTLHENGHVIGSPHALHNKIRELGGGRYSHWYDSIVFSTTDGSDPRTNGQIYTVEARTEVNMQWRVAILLLLALVDASIFSLFQREILVFCRSRVLQLTAIAMGSIVVATGLTALGIFGIVTVAKSGAPKDAALAVSVLLHACLGCLISFGTWAAGAGLIRLVLRDRSASMRRILIPAFPLGLIAITILTAISLALPYGRIVALSLWAACVVPLLYWRPSYRGIRAGAIATVSVIPFAIFFGVWLALLWHGPTTTLSGSPTGDMTYYAGSVWSLADRPFPYVDLTYENGLTRSYFNNLFSAMGAVLLPLPGFDPFLFLLASGGTAYILFTGLMLHLYASHHARKTTNPSEIWLLVLAVLVAARYPYWVVESIPVIFVPALVIAVWWMTERGKQDFRWSIAAMLAGLGGSMLSKVVTAAVLVPVGSTGIWGKVSRLPDSIRIVAVVVGIASGIYCAAMLWHFLPLFLGLAHIGPESLQNPKWYFVLRDLGALLLIPLAWMITDRSTALVLSLGIATFLSFAFIFQINFVAVAILIGLIMFARRTTSRWVWVLAFTALAMSLPATVFSDPAGTSSGIVWIICLGGAAFISIYCALPVGNAISSLTTRISFTVGLAALAATGFGLVGAARGFVIADSGWHLRGSQLTPDLKDIWTAVSKLTPRDCLIFTDQVDETINVIGGWNTYALRGERQIYLSSYYTSFELRNDQTKLHRVLSINDSVLTGALKPSQVSTKHRYNCFFAVVSTSRLVPPSWQMIISNERYAIFRIEP